MDIQRIIIVTLLASVSLKLCTRRMLRDIVCSSWKSGVHKLIGVFVKGKYVSCYRWTCLSGNSKKSRHRFAHLPAELEVALKKAGGLRNILVHEYAKIDWTIIQKVKRETTGS